jgi:eukaryotic-like serine/threonine-protein kinase
MKVNNMSKIALHKVMTVPIIVSFFAITILLLLSSNYNNYQSFAQQGNFSTYKNTTHGIEIQYPSDWVIMEQGKSPFVMSPDVITLLSPNNNNSSKTIPATFRVSVQNVNVTLDDYTNKTVGLIVENTPGAKIIESKTTTLAGIPAHKVLGMFKQEDKDINVIDEWAIKNEQLYRITFYSEQGSYSSYLPTVQKMIDSFVIMK